VVEVTHAAREALRELVQQSLSQHADQRNFGPRLVQCERPTGEVTLRLALDEAGSDDVVLEHRNQTVLIVSKSGAAALDGRTLDVVETSEGQRLTIR
jgi:Fe-S cluster assembly iron-binding protein IscA